MCVTALNGVSGNLIQSVILVVRVDDGVTESSVLELTINSYGS